MQVNGPTARKLRDALREAYDPHRFTMMLADQLNLVLAHISMGPNFDVVVFEVIDYFNKRYEIEKLVRAARLSNPTSLDLRVFEEQYVLSGGQIQPLSLPPGVPSYAELYHNLQRMVTNLAMLDPKLWRRRLGELESRICKVILPSGQGVGTGFLVGPDLVMTNYHVVEKVVGKQDKVKLVKLRFDYALLAEGQQTSAGGQETSAGGQEISTGVDYSVAEIVDYSEYSLSDTLANPPHDAEADKLDYALLRVDGSPGHDLPGGSANNTMDVTVKPRGWIEQPELAPDLRQPTPIFILQHPQGLPLKLALATSDQIQVNQAGTRVRYSTNTLEGSSGSPCFDHNWNLVALHHAGDPAYAGIGLAAYNQGIPFTAIFALLKQRGKQELLLQTVPQRE